MKHIAIILAVISLVLLGVFGLFRSSTSVVEDSASEMEDSIPVMEDMMTTAQLEQYLMDLDREFDLATADNGIEGWVSYFAPDGKMFPAGMNVVQGRDEIRAVMGPALDDPNYSLRWQPVFAEVSSSGDLGYTHGTYVASGVDADGNPVQSYGKYVSIWRKQPDGTWKIVVDLGTPSPAPQE